LYGTAIEWRNDASGLWRPDLDDFDPDILRLTQEMNPSLIRFPGGLLTDFYHWKDGIGPRPERVTVEPWPEGPPSPTTFGTDEVLNFAHQVGGNVLPSVNIGTGTAQEAAEWVRYINDGRPGYTKYWEVGNEIYNTGGFAALYVTMPPEKYANKFVEFARAMKEEDPNIKVGGVGHENYGRYILSDYPAWNPYLLTIAGDDIDFVATHNAFAPVNLNDQDLDVRTVYTNMLAAPQAVRRNLRTISTEIDYLAPKRRKEIGIGVSEWGPLFQFEPSPYVLHVRTLGSALYIASVLKQFIDTPKVMMSCTFNLVSDGFIGWIAKRGNEYIANAQLLALKMFTRYFGDIRVSSRYGCPTFNSTALGIFEAEENVPYLDVLASVSQDKSKLYVMIVNKHFDSPFDVIINISGFKPSSRGTAYTLTGTGLDANTGADLGGWGEQKEDEVNPRFYLGAPSEVYIDTALATGLKEEFTWTVPAHSIVSLEIPRG
jgi:alpha-N-arabinofuranosidase